MTHYRILANAPEADICRLASLVMHEYPREQVKILHGPSVGLVMLRMRETVANSLFNAGEVLVTEVRLTLNEQFGFGMVIGDSPRRALAVALVDAALRLEGAIAARLRQELETLDQHIAAYNAQEQRLALATKVEFERM
ncbi:phosphonate C-P lyase system protein PhnG [Ktedonospora formicarum]|uniref:Phosphonate C-P lyase system protein PhnG n=1 Tax=Ktedonospora formicarum TaxID=2778364 RepID=A0A8J3HXT9_9CHLR|nr:phosphonate C-P lyase system protein PhnG [Ktedonospora formicarum]GHO41959.1 phosphonate C-P lyase system protein PhnG [Ktedonospora formicarum]